MAATTEPIWAVTTEKINEAVKRIIAAANPRKVMVFGSQARGNLNPDSDLDLMVILDEVRGPRAEAVRLRRLLSGLIMAVDLLVVSKEQFQYWRDTPGNVFFEANLEGRVLYEAP